MERDYTYSVVSLKPILPGLQPLFVLAVETGALTAMS